MAVRGNTPREISNALRNAAGGGGGGGFTSITTTDDAVAEGVNYQLTVGGETFFVYFNGMTVLRAEQAVSIRYAEELDTTGLTATEIQAGKATDDTTIFDIPFDTSGNGFDFRGTAFFDTIQAPNNASAYEWANSKGADGDDGILYQIFLSTQSVEGLTWIDNKGTQRVVTATVFKNGEQQTIAATTVAGVDTYQWKISGNLVDNVGYKLAEEDDPFPQDFETVTGSPSVASDRKNVNFLSGTGATKYRLGQTTNRNPNQATITIGPEDVTDRSTQQLECIVDII